MSGKKSLPKEAYRREEVQAIIDDIEAGHFLDLPEVEGYSSPKVKNLLHRLVGLRRTKYLEIGVHLGSTFIPAMYSYTGRKGYYGTAIDAWNMFGDLEDRFKKNLKEHGLYNSHCYIRHVDFRQINYADIHDPYRFPNPINVYFYDGDHGRDCQYQAFAKVAPILADQFIAIVDDFNWAEPREETYRALRDLHYTIEAEWLLPGPYNGSREAWWNGLFVGIIRKG